MHHDPALFLWLTCGKSYVYQWKINPLNCRDNSYIVMKLQLTVEACKGKKTASSICGSLSFPLLLNILNSLKCLEIPLIEMIRYKTLAVLYAYNIEGISVML